MRPLGSRKSLQNVTTTWWIRLPDGTDKYLTWRDDITATELKVLYPKHSIIRRIGRRGEEISMRPYPKHFDTYYKMAKELKVPCPKGAALFVVNRIQNGDWWQQDLSAGYAPAVHNDLVKMCKERILATRESTSRRWLAHWEAGGHIKTLRAPGEQNRWRRELDARNRRQNRELRNRYAEKS